MGSTLKLKPTDVYGALIHMYPPSFRKHYGVTMVQTFDDMLQAEVNRTGRWLIWVRALADLPLSAAKEHITNGGDIIMNRVTKLILICALAAIVIVGLGAFWFGTLQARQNVGVVRVGVAEVANAMQQDRFYADYGNSALLFSGKIAAVQPGNKATLVTFVTGRPYSVTCQFPTSQTVKPGQIISVAAPGGSADRQKHGVLLHDCVEN
jgi:hypothetical protein